LPAPKRHNIGEVSREGETDALHHRNRVNILTNGAQFYPAMRDAISAAQTSVNLEAYIFQPGQAAVVGRSATSILSFTAKGTPASGSASPAARLFYRAALDIDSEEAIRKDISASLFGRRWSASARASVDDVEQGFAESRPGRDEGEIAVGPRLTLLQRREFVPRESEDAISHRLEIVEQTHTRNAQRPDHVSAVHAPRDVGHLGRLIDDRARDAEHRGLDRRHRRLRRAKGVDDGRQPRELGRDKGSHIEPARSPRCRVEESDERLGAADVAREDHLSSGLL